MRQIGDLYIHVLSSNRMSPKAGGVTLGVSEGLGVRYVHWIVHHRVDAIHSAHEKQKSLVDWPREPRGLDDATKGMSPTQKD